MESCPKKCYLFFSSFQNFFQWFVKLGVNKILKFWEFFVTREIYYGLFQSSSHSFKTNTQTKVMICRKKYIHRSRSIWLAIFCFFEFDLFNCLSEGSTKFKGKVSVFPIFEFFHAYGQSNQSAKQNKNSL